MSKKGVLQQLKLEKYLSSLFSTQPNAYDSSPASEKQTPSDKGTIERSRKQQNYQDSPSNDQYMNNAVLTRSQYKAQKERILAAETQLDSAKVSPFGKISELSASEARTPSSKDDFENKLDLKTRKKLNLLDEFDIPSTRKPTPAGFLDNVLNDPDTKYDPKDYIKKDLKFESKKGSESSRQQSNYLKKDLEPIDEKVGDSFDDSDHLLMEKIFQEADRYGEREDEDAQFNLLRDREITGAVIELPKFNELDDSLEDKFISEANQRIFEEKMRLIENKFNFESFAINSKKLKEYSSEGQYSNPSNSKINIEKNNSSKSSSLKDTQKAINTSIKQVDAKITETSKLFQQESQAANADNKAIKPKLLQNTRDILKNSDSDPPKPEINNPSSKPKKLSKEETLKKLMKAFGDDPDEEDIKLRELLEMQLAQLEDLKAPKSETKNDHNPTKLVHSKSEQPSKPHLHSHQHEAKPDLKNIFRDKLENSMTDPSEKSESRKSFVQSQKLSIPNLIDNANNRQGKLSQNPTPIKGLEVLSHGDLKKSLTKGSPKNPDAMAIEEEGNLFKTAGNNKPLKITQKKMDFAQKLLEENEDEFAVLKSSSQLFDPSKRLTVTKQNSIHQSEKIFKDDEPKKIFNMDLTNYKLNPNKDSSKKKIIGVTKKDTIDRVFKLFNSKDTQTNKEVIDNKDLQLKKETSSKIIPEVPERKKSNPPPSDDPFLQESLPAPIKDQPKHKYQREENSQGLWPEKRKDGPNLLRGKPKYIPDPDFEQQTLNQPPIQSSIQTPIQTAPVKQLSPILGFQTARGNRLEADPDVLQSLKGFLEENSNSKPIKNESVSPRETSRSEHTNNTNNSTKFNMRSASKIPTPIGEQEDEMSNFNVKILSPKSSVHDKSNSMLFPKSPKIEYDIKINSPNPDELLRPTEDPDDEPIKQETKRRLTNEEGAKREKFLNDKTNTNSNSNGNMVRFNIRASQVKPENKKPQGMFKFKENSDTSAPSSSKKTPATAKSSTTRNQDGKESSNNKLTPYPLKRNFDAFLTELESPNKKNFEENAKIQKFLKTLRFKGPSQYALSPNCTYFSLDNLKAPNKKNTAINSITAANATNHTFACVCASGLGNSNSNKLSDQASFLCGCNGTLIMGWPEMRNALLQEGLKSDYVTEDWIMSHYRFIVWKFASIERSLQNFHSSKRLTYSNVKNEIEYRYYIEHVLNKRSALKKITESDERSTLHMILLVGEIAFQNNIFHVELTDGWFSVYFEVFAEGKFKEDKNSLTNNQLLYLLLKNKKLISGMKVHCQGMRILKKDISGGKTSPFTSLLIGEPKVRYTVEVSYNGISRAKWDEKLGISQEKFCIRNLISLRNNGGIIPMIDVFVVKKYQILERTNGSTRIFQPDDEEVINRSNIFFKIKVVDAVVYYDETSIEKYSNINCEIEISSMGVPDCGGLVVETYGAIMEHARIRFYNLKGYTKYSSSIKFYDHATQSQTSQYLYLQYTKATKLQNLSDLNEFRGEYMAFQEFSKKNFGINNFLLSSIKLNEKPRYNFYHKDIKNFKNEIDLVGVILESDHQKMIGLLRDGNLFKLMIHSKQHFPNIKLLDKRESVIVIRNAQVDQADKITGEDAYCFMLRTSDNTFFTSSTALFKAEAEKVEEISKNKTEMDRARKRLDKLLKRKNGLNNSNSIDFEALDKMMLEGTNANKGDE